jgi:hypothetical protein
VTEAEAMHVTELIEEMLKSRPDAKAVVLGHSLWCEFILDRIGDEVPEDGDVYEEAKGREFFVAREPDGVRVLEGDDVANGKAEVISWPDVMPKDYAWDPYSGPGPSWEGGDNPRF